MGVEGGGRKMDKGTNKLRGVIRRDLSIINARLNDGVLVPLLDADAAEGAGHAAELGLRRGGQGLLGDVHEDVHHVPRGVGQKNLAKTTELKELTCFKAALHLDN